MAAPRGPVARIAALVIYIIVILVATPQAQQPVSFAGSPGAIAAGPPAAIDHRDGDRSVRRALHDPERRLDDRARVADRAGRRRRDGDRADRAPDSRQDAGHDLPVRVGPRRRHQDLRGQRPPRPEAARPSSTRSSSPARPSPSRGSGKDVVLSGTVSSKYVIDKAADVAAGFVDKKENVVNLLKQQEGVASNQVMLRVRFAEVSRNAHAGARRQPVHRRDRLQGRDRAARRRSSSRRRTSTS